MSKQADKLLEQRLEESDGHIEWNDAVDAVKRVCDVKTNTAETYIRRSDKATTEVTADGDKVISQPGESGETVVHDEDEVLEMEVGDATSQTFGELNVLEDVDHPLVPDGHEDGYFRRRLVDKKTDVQVVTSAMDDPDFSTLLIGEAGVGKDKLILHICANTNRPVVRVTASGDNDLVDLLIGHYAPQGDGEEGFEFKKGLIPICMENGYAFVLDEGNMLDGRTQSQLNGLLEDADQKKLTIPETNEVIRPHEEFKFMMTMNPQKVGYGGTQDLNQAFKSRFFPIEVPPLDTNAEKQVVSMNTEWEVNDRELDTLVGDDGVIPGIRALYNSGKVSTWVSTRDAIKVGKMAHKLGDPKTAAKLVLSGMASPEDRDPIESAIEDQIW